MQTPFFPVLRPRLAAPGRRAVPPARQTTLARLQRQLGDFLPAPLLSPEEDGPNSRERAFSPRLTFECFVWQMLKPKTSCREVVRQVQALLRLRGGPCLSQEDSAYVQARRRLPVERMEKALCATAQTADRLAGLGGRLGRRPVKVVDASTLQLPDTRRNQKDYPQPGSQKQGCGFPVMRILAVLSLNSGALVQIVVDSLKHHELGLFHRLWEHLKRGDVVLGDRAYGEFTTAAALPQRGVDLVARLHHQRKVDFRKAKRLGKNDGLFVWKKGYQQTKILTPAQWEALPEEITVRILRFTATIRGFRGRRVTLVTTLLDPVLYPAEELAALYARRWFMELSFRSIKSAMGLEWLTCKSPELAGKELLACLIAYNIVRCVMAEAASCHQVDLERVSFKGAADALRQYSAAIAQARNGKLRRRLWLDLLLNLARDLVPHRPDRREPRAVKIRPKAYPLLNQPRRKFIEISHRGRYWKGRPRNYRGLN
jgi:hypothetical protein